MTCFAVTSSIEYNERLKVFLYSLYRTNPDVHVLCRLVNYDDRRTLQSIFPKIEFVLSNTLLSKQRNRLKGDQSWKYASLSSVRKCSFLVSDYECYCNNKRFENIITALDAGYKRVISADIDIIANKKIDFNKLYKDYDIIFLNENEPLLSETGIILTKPENMWYPGRWLNSDFRTNMPICEESVIGASNTSNVYRFFKKANTLIQDNFLSWDADYQILNQLYYEFLSNIKFGNLPVEYSDRWFFSENSYVWNGAAEIKYINANYINKYAQLLKETQLSNTST